MDLRDLKYFVAIAHAGSTRRASVLVHRTQPTLTKAVSRLEASLGAQLFEREGRGRGQRLSAAGQALLSRATSLLSIADSVRGEVAALGQGTSGIVRLGSGPMGAEYLLPRLCALLINEAPDVQLQLTIRINYELREELRDQRLDFVLGYVPEVENEFVCETLLQDTVVVVASPTHPIFNEKKPGIKSLTPFRWVLPNRSVASRIWLDEVFASQELSPPIAQVETNSIPLVPQVIAHTNLLSFISRRTLQSVNGALREVKLPATTLVRNFGVTFSKEVPLLPTASRFISLLHTHGRDLFEGN